MSWRKPRSPREKVDATCENLRELADAYHPFVAFVDTERFFPILAEAWLSHSTNAAWPTPRKAPMGGPFDRPVDPFRRGSAVCDAPADVRSVSVLGGTPNDDDRPIQLSDDPSDRDSISGYHGVEDTVFLDFGGWADRGTTLGLAGGFQGLGGDLTYLFQAFSELAGAMNPDLSWVPIELRGHLPEMWIDQPPTPTAYCEARWAGDFANASAALAAPDFPDGAEGLLDDVLVLTYHYLFPAREPSDGEPDTRPLEGQWEAISIYFRGQRGEGDQPGAFFEPPLAVVAGQGSDAPGPLPFASQAHAWSDVTTATAAPTHPILLASQGTHRFFFAPTSGVPWTPGGPGAPATDNGSYDNNSEFPGWESVLVGGLLAAAAALLFIPVIGWIVAAVIAIIALLIWLISLIADLCSSGSENPANPFPTNPEAGGDGPWGGDADEPPAPGGSGGGADPGGSGSGSGTGEWGLPNSGSPSGANTVSFDVRFINRTPRRLDANLTGYPSDQPCENPTWWDYSGRWGVRVPSALTGTWASGQQRVDKSGRCRGYWNTLRFLRDVVLAP